MKNLLTFTLVALSFLSTAQQKENVIVQAMKDELNRNMAELKYENLDRPFYIGYSARDLYQHELAASMGALLRSHSEHNRFKNVRVLVGDYSFNDESLDNDQFSGPEANEIDLPLEDDYFGIRRAFWVTTDYVYKNAARQFKKNQETQREKNKALNEIPHRTFAKAAPLQITVEAEPYQYDQAHFEKYIREISGVFLEFPGIESSAVYMQFNEGYDHFVNSEGTSSRTPVRQTTLQIYGQRKTEDGENIADQLTCYSFTPGTLPPLEEVKREVVNLCRQIMEAPSVDVFDEEYRGPVLFTGQAVAETFSTGLFSFREPLIATDRLPNPDGYRLENTSLLDGRIGKQVAGKNITVRSRPTLRTYENTDLLGTYEIDDEGIVPPDNLVLIDKGVLKALLNNRSLLRSEESANGHGDGPAVTEVIIDNGVPLATLKKKLIEQAKEEGLEYALIVSKASGKMTSTITRIYVADEKEEVLRGGIVESLTLRNFREIMGATTTSKAFNLQTGNRKITSFIVPDGVLFEEVEVKKGQIPFFKEEQYVSNPLKK